MDEPRIVHRSARDAVVWKPAGLSTERPHADDARPREPDLLEQAAALLGWPDARLPHRLDRETSGLVVVARDGASVAILNRSIGARSRSPGERDAWTKCYLARVVPRDRRRQLDLVGTHRRYLRREGRRAVVVRSGGDPAWLDVLAVAPAPPDGRALDCAIRLRTGRYHQIRAMAADLGVPLAGDVLYGGDASDGPIRLEHALLAYPSLDGGTVLVWRRQDPGRASVAPEVLDALDAIAAECVSEGATIAST
jgi:23S rRNA-/tRNA-specific pseudouridylate synthase